MSRADVPEVRNLSFGIGPEVPRRWHSTAQSVTSFFNNLSVFFPPGERYFIASVNAFRDRVGDDALLAQVRAFGAQEGVHSREHQRYNAMLREQGYPVEAMERRVVRLIDRVARLIPRRWSLAATCALEHFTALMGHVLLDDPRILEGAHPVMRELWRWHAAEENEHKAVAFDVYEAAGGTYPERVFVMVMATVIFWSKVAEHQVRLMHADGTLGSLEEWRALVEWICVRPGWVWRLARLYLDYYRPGFHPWQLDSSGLLAAWLRGRSAWSPYVTERARPSGRASAPVGEGA